MEQSEQQKEVLELGKLLVKELGLEKSVDTLSRWMAHYVAENIKAAEALPDGAKKRNAEKECFSLILDLWKNRWHYKPDRQPLRNFNHLFNILQNLDPEKEDPYYFRWNNSQLKEDDNDPLEFSNLQNLSSYALQIDKVARIWIDYLLREAVAKASNEKVKRIIERAFQLPDSTDAHIIQLILEEVDDADAKPFDQEEWNRKNKISTLTRRIEELQKFKKANEYLIGQFESELIKFKSGNS